MIRSTKVPAILLPLLLATLTSGPSWAEESGKETFLAQKCNKCHSVDNEGIDATVKSEKMRGPDLSTVGKERDTLWIKQYLLKELQLNDKEHRAKWDSSDKDLQRIADWLAALK